MAGMSPRKMMGMGSLNPKTTGNRDNEFSVSPGSTGDFGVAGIPGGVPAINHMDRENGGNRLEDHERKARHPIENGRRHLANQANPDHGPHHLHPDHHPAGPVMDRKRTPNKAAW